MALGLGFRVESLSAIQSCVLGAGFEPESLNPKKSCGMKESDLLGLC